MDTGIGAAVGRDRRKVGAKIEPELRIALAEPDRCGPLESAASGQLPITLAPASAVVDRLGHRPGRLKTACPLAHTRDQHGGQVGRLTDRKAETPGALFVMPDAEHDDALVGMPCGTEADSSIVDEIFPG